MRAARRLVGALAILLAAGLAAGGALAEATLAGPALPAETVAPCAPEMAEIRGPRGAVRFHVEIADTEPARAQGLMHRESLPSASGMLFIYDRPQPVSFWMKNTLLPLDMIFLDERGVVRRVHENARPLDEAPIPGGPDVLAVLEIRGGLARRLGIGPGAEMRHPAFDPARAAWSCAAP